MIFICEGTHIFFCTHVENNTMYEAVLSVHVSAKIAGDNCLNAVGFDDPGVIKLLEY